MLRSMTGYGEAEHISPEIQFKIEIKSINQKKLEIYQNLPYFLQPFENDIRNFISKKIKRGKLNLFFKLIHWKRETKYFLDEDKLAQIINYVKSINEKFSLKVDLDFRSIMHLPEVFSSHEETIPAKEALEVLEPVVNAAVDQLIVSKQKEGEFLHDEIGLNLAQIEKSINHICNLKIEGNEILKEEYRKKMQKIMEEFGTNGNFDENRFYQELSYLYDKNDIQEEIVRLRSHLNQFREIVKNHEAPGKALNFLLQEMNRESNTLGVKGYYLPIIQENLKIKEEIEKIKEQIQNVE